MSKFSRSVGKSPIGLAKKPEKKNKRITIYWVDSYQHGSSQTGGTTVYEGPDIGFNMAINSTISTPLTIFQECDETGKVIRDETVFLMHTFIKKIVLELID
jgi:hypothetical protein